MEVLKSITNPSQHPGELPEEKKPQSSAQLLEWAHVDNDTVLKELKTKTGGLSTALVIPGH